MNSSTRSVPCNKLETATVRLFRYSVQQKSFLYREVVDCGDDLSFLPSRDVITYIQQK